MELLRVGAGTAIPKINTGATDKMDEMGVPDTALMTLTAGVKIPSAMTQHAPYKVQPSNNVLTNLFSRIHAPLTGLPAKSAVESIVSVTVSRSESSWFRGVSLSRLRYRLKSIYNTNVPPKNQTRL